MKSNARKTIAQKKKRKSGSSMRKTKTQRTLLINRSRISEKEFAKICCRCELRIGDNEHALGGGYDGVVCLSHRSCSGCWFETTARGARKFEAAKTKHIGLVNKPFKGTTPLCPGCRKGLPPFAIKPKPTTFREDSDGIISIEDSDFE